MGHMQFWTECCGANMMIWVKSCHCESSTIWQYCPYVFFIAGYTGRISHYLKFPYTQTLYVKSTMMTCSLMWFSRLQSQDAGQITAFVAHLLSLLVLVWLVKEQSVSWCLMFEETQESFFSVIGLHTWASVGPELRWEVWCSRAEVSEL